MYAAWNWIVSLGLPTPADEIPGDFFESLEIPGVPRFLPYKRPSKNELPLLFLFFAIFLDLTKLNLQITSHYIQVKVSYSILSTIPIPAFHYFNVMHLYNT